MDKITKFLIFLIVVVVLIVVATAVFIGAGYLLSLVLPLTLFQSSILCIGAAFAAVFIISAITILPFRVTYTNEKESDKDDNDYENIEEESDNFSKSRFTIVDTKKVGRNEPCPCGSGKKYKYCCEKKKGQPFPDI